MSSWGNRIVRRKHQYTFPDGKMRVDFTYGIHEAYYDKFDKVVAITQDPIDPHGETVADLRRGWVMMGEAFGLPVLDYDQIPELGHDPENLLVRTDDLRRQIEEELTSEESRDESKEEQKPLLPDFDRDAYEKEQEAERALEEKNHNEKFLGTIPFKELVNKIFSDYEESRKKE